MKSYYTDFKTKLKKIKEAITYPDGKSKEFDKKCDQTFFKWLDMIINIMWFVFCVQMIAVVFYFGKYYVF